MIALLGLLKRDDTASRAAAEAPCAPPVVVMTRRKGREQVATSRAFAAPLPAFWPMMICREAGRRYYQYDLYTMPALLPRVVSTLMPHDGSRDIS